MKSIIFNRLRLLTMIWPTAVNPWFLTGHVYSFRQRCISVWSVKDIFRRRRRHQTIFRLPSPQQPHSSIAFRHLPSWRKDVVNQCLEFAQQLHTSRSEISLAAASTTCSQLPAQPYAREHSSCKYFNPINHLLLLLFKWHPSHNKDHHHQSQLCPRRPGS